MKKASAVPVSSRSVALGAALGLALTAAGCGLAPGATDAGDATGTLPPGACNAIANVAAVVNDQADPSAAPAMTGGTIIDGTYVQTSQVLHGRATTTPRTRRTTLVINGGTANLVQQSDGGADQRTTFTVTVGPGAQIRMAATCPSTGVLDANAYTANATQFQLFNPTNGALSTFVRQ